MNHLGQKYREEYGYDMTERNGHAGNLSTASECCASQDKIITNDSLDETPRSPYVHMRGLLYIPFNDAVHFYDRVMMKRFREKICAGPKQQANSA